MKNLDNVLEGLLDADFDINVEPVLYNFKSKDLNFMFGRFLDNYNETIVSYSVCNQAIDQLKQIVDNLKSFEPQTSHIDNLAQGLGNTIKGWSNHLTKADYDAAVDWLAIMRPLVAIAESVEKIIIKMSAPKLIKIAPAINGSDKWVISLHQEQWTSGANWVEDNREKLIAGIKKIRNVGAIVYDENKRSIYIEGK